MEITHRKPDDDPADEAGSCVIDWCPEVGSGDDGLCWEHYKQYGDETGHWRLY